MWEVGWDPVTHPKDLRPSPNCPGCPKLAFLRGYSPGTEAFPELSWLPQISIPKGLFPRDRGHWNPSVSSPRLFSTAPLPDTDVSAALDGLR